MKPEDERRIAYLIDGGDERQRVDVMADRNLVRISLFELFGLQVLIAVAIWLDVRLLSFPLGWLLLPLAITLWGAFRLRHFPFLNWANPFTIGIASTMLSFAIYLTISIWHPPWAPVFGPVTLSNFVGVTLFGGLALGCLLGFFSLLVVKAWSSASGEAPPED
jgi:hypothetical protein